MRAQVHSLGLDQLVTFCGVVTDPRSVLRATDVVVLPSTQEGTPNVLIEAMACGVVCVAPPSAGGNDLLAGGAGLVATSNDADELAAAVLRLWREPDLRNSIGAAATARARQFDSEEVVERYTELYAAIQGPSGR